MIHKGKRLYLFLFLSLFFCVFLFFRKTGEIKAAPACRIVCTQRMCADDVGTCTTCTNNCVDINITRIPIDTEPTEIPVPTKGDCIQPPGCLCATGRNRCLMPWSETYCSCPVPTEIPVPTSTGAPTETPVPTEIISPSIAPDPCPLVSQGDANCDQVINNSDYDILKLKMMGQLYPTNCSNCSADFNKDNKIDLVDYEIWRNTFYQ